MPSASDTRPPRVETPNPLRCRRSCLAPRVIRVRSGGRAPVGASTPCRGARSAAGSWSLQVPVAPGAVTLAFPLPPTVYHPVLLKSIRAVKKSGLLRHPRKQVPERLPHELPDDRRRVPNSPVVAHPHGDGHPVRRKPMPPGRQPDTFWLSLKSTRCSTGAGRDRDFPHRPGDRRAFSLIVVRLFLPPRFTRTCP